MKRTRLIIIFMIVGVAVGVGGWLLNRFPDRLGFEKDRMVREQMPGQETLQGTFVPRPDRDGWVTVTSGPDAPAAIRVTDEGPDLQILEFELPGFNLESEVVAGRSCDRITIPGLTLIREVGLPELPMLATSLMIPSDGRTRLTVTEHVIREMAVDPVIPSLGHIYRDVDPAQIRPTFSTFYSSGGIWPEAATVLSEPFILRDVRGVNVRFHPLRYDAARGVLLITERLVVEVATTGSGGQNTLEPVSGAHKATAGTGDFSTVNRQLFGNYRAQIGSAKYESLANHGRMLIVTDADYVDAMAPFIAWKQQLGITVAMVTTAQTGASADLIKQAIKDHYTDPAGLVWVILVGDKQQIPTCTGAYDGSDSDSIYAMIAGNDVYPDVFISRISANTVIEVQTQVAKFIAYEKSPASGGDADWYRRAACIASREGLPPDYTRADEIRDDLLSYNFETAAGIYEGQGGSSNVIEDALVEGCSLITYLGHGNGTAWESVPFSTSDISVLDNAGRTPWIIDISCSNGNLDLTECFAEAWLRAGTPDSPCGAVAILSATSRAPWIPPTVMQTEIINLLTSEQATSIGALFYSGLMKMLDQYAGLGVADQVVEQNIIFGDCSLMVRTAEPTRYQVDSVSYLKDTTNSLRVEVTGPAGSVVALTYDGTLYGSAFIDADGTAEVAITEPLTEVTSLLMTVSGYNMEPFITTLSVGDGDGGNIASTPPARVELLGKYPNPFTPDTRIAFELPRDMRVKLAIYDIRGYLVKVLADEQMTVGRHELTWRGNDADGRRVASGVYLYRLVTQDCNQTGRMTLSK